MTEIAKKIVNLRSPEQFIQQNETLEPWLRQKGESARWFMRFQVYLELGPKRTLRATIDTEPDQKKNKRRDEGKPRSVSIPGAWQRASKLWRWKERAKAYDLALMEKHADFLRQSANRSIYASRAFRIRELNWLATVLKEQIKPELELKDMVALATRLQSILRDIATEMEGLEGVTSIQCDAAALQTMIEETEKKLEAEKLKNMAMHEKNKYLFDKYDKEGCQSTHITDTL